MGIIDVSTLVDHPSRDSRHRHSKITGENSTKMRKREKTGTVIVRGALSRLRFFYRLLNPAFADGMTAPRISRTGDQLPLSRIVSRTMHPDEGYHDHAGTVMVIAWGQFMDHDYTLTATPLGKFYYKTVYKVS